jgi:PAP2 superfamily
MTRETYRKMTGYFLQDEKKVRRIILANRLLTGIVFVSYPLYLISLLLKRDTLLPQAVLVPAVSFVVVTLFRKIVNEPRPYEKYDLPPVIDKDTGGKSFPSRHVFSVFVIAVTVFVRNPVAGCILAMIGIMIAVIRVIGGVHTVWDVTAGAAVGILSGVIGYYMLPYQGF